MTPPRPPEGKHSPTPWEPKDVLGRSIAIYGADNKLACEVYVAEGLEDKGIANAKFLVHAVNLHAKLIEALQMLYLETVDYITINHLGDPHHNQSMKLAKEVLALAKEKSE